MFITIRSLKVTDVLFSLLSKSEWNLLCLHLKPSNKQININLQMKESIHVRPAIIKKKNTPQVLCRSCCNSWSEQTMLIVVGSDFIKNWSSKRPPNPTRFIFHISLCVWAEIDDAVHVMSCSCKVSFLRKSVKWLCMLYTVTGSSLQNKNLS